MASEQEKFLSDVENKSESVFDENLEVAANPEKEESVEEKEERKNRAYRRLEQKYQKEREAAIALGERVKVLSEVDKFREEAGGDNLKEVEAIFGTDTPEKLAATNILKKALSGMSDSAVEKALERIQSQQDNESKAVREAEDEIDEGLEIAEDATGLDLSEGSRDRQGFLTLVERLAKKDKNGDIVEYPDFETAAELYVRTKERPVNTRARDLASRSMTHSGESVASKLEEDAVGNYLKENGILW